VTTPAVNMTPEEAWSRLEPCLEALPPVGVERTAAAGRVLAAPLLATVDVPGADVSAMDGYAYAGELAAGAALPVAATIAAGQPPGLVLAAGEAAAIMTGAPVPAGADRVVPVERTDGGRERVAIRQPVELGANVRRRAEVLAAGDEILPAGCVVTPGALALVATHGHGKVSVHRRPTVAVLTTGDEVVPPEATPAPGQLRDSHTDFLRAAGATLGLAFAPLGIAPDEPRELARRVARGLEADVLLIGGGVSRGEFDLVEDVLAAHGCEILFDHVAIQPGKPLVAARHAGGLVFGLPGNPASVMACFWLFVRPALRRLEGLRDGFWEGVLDATVAAALPAAPDRDRFLPATVEFRAGELVAHPSSPKGSHDLMAWARGSALVRVRAGSHGAPAGARCQVLPLANWPADAAAGG
jgi:molybdopterin molybdotransferase